MDRSVLRSLKTGKIEICGLRGSPYIPVSDYVFCREPTRIQQKFNTERERGSCVYAAFDELYKQSRVPYRDVNS